LEARSVFLEAPTRAIVFVFVMMRRITSSSLWNDPDILENLAEFPMANANGLHLIIFWGGCSRHKESPPQGCYFFSGRAVTISFTFSPIKSLHTNNVIQTKEEAKKMTRKYSTISTQDKPSHNHQAPP
jgi:hypothetical protein